MFEATLDRSIGIERPPPRSSFATGGTTLDALATIRTQRYFAPAARKRLVIVLTDGETQPVAGARLAALFRRPPADRHDLRAVLGLATSACSRAARPSRSTGPIRPRVPSLEGIAAADRRQRLRRGRRRGGEREGETAARNRARRSSVVSRRHGFRSRRTSPPPRSCRWRSSCGGATADVYSSRLLREPGLDGFRESALVHVRDRAACEPDERPRGSPSERTARTTSSPCCGPPRSPALARRSLQSVSAARSTSLPCSSYHCDAGRSLEDRARLGDQPRGIVGGHVEAGVAGAHLPRGVSIFAPF